MSGAVEAIEHVGHGSAMSDRAFAELYAALFPQVKAFLARAGCEAHSLDDLAQETFLRAWYKRWRFSGAAQFRTWVFGIARNTARESRRKAAHARAFAPRVVADMCLPPADDEEEFRALRAAIEALPAKQRVAITLVYLDGLSQLDAAMVSKCTPVAFRRRLANARCRLRVLMRSQ